MYVQPGHGYDPWLPCFFWVVRTAEQTLTLHVPHTSAAALWLAQQPRGTTLRCSAILGAPLHIQARSLLVLSETSDQGALVPLVERTSAAGGAVVMLAAGPEALRIPAFIFASDVEYLAHEHDFLTLLDGPLNEAVSALQWADTIVCVGHHATALELVQRLRRERLRWTRKIAWYLPPLTMLCGQGICGSCWVSTRKSRHLACQQGVFYDLYELPAVAEELS